MKELTFLSLFAGIGGFDLGLERAGMRCVGQVEIDPFCRAVLAKHWPGVKRMEDVRAVKGDEFGPVDFVVGGVPCQPASCAGKRKGDQDDRWLWPEFVRIVRASGCVGFIAENVRGFLSLPAAAGVVRDLEGAGYEVRTLLLGAHHVGAPHRRDRIWIVGKLADRHGRGLGRTQSSYEVNRSVVQTDGQSRDDAGSQGAHIAGLANPSIARGGAVSVQPRGQEQAHTDAHGAGERVADAPARRRGTCEQHTDARESNAQGSGDGGSLADPACIGRSGEGNRRIPEHAQPGVYGEGRETRWPSRPGEPQHEWEAPRLFYANRQPTHGPPIPRGERGDGATESRLGGAADGLPRRLVSFGRRNALKSYGNSIVPAVAEVIGRAVIAAMREECAA